MVRCYGRFYYLLSCLLIAILDGGKQPSLEEPESGVREALHLGGGGAGTGHRSNQVNTIKETEGCGMGRGDVPEVTRPCDNLLLVVGVLWCGMGVPAVEETDVPWDVVSEP